MIIVMKPNAPKEAVQKVTSLVQSKGLETHLSEGKQVTIIGVVGDKTLLANENLQMLPYVDRLVPITESYKLANKKFHPEPTKVQVGDHIIGPDTLTIMAGPCAVETEEQLMLIAENVKKAGAQILRGGAYKPRTSPYSFQGLEEEGLKYMKEAKEAKSPAAPARRTRRTHPKPPAGTLPWGEEEEKLSGLRVTSLRGGAKRRVTADSPGADFLVGRSLKELRTMVQERFPEAAAIGRASKFAFWLDSHREGREFLAEKLEGTVRRRGRPPKATTEDKAKK